MVPGYEDLFKTSSIFELAFLFLVTDTVKTNHIQNQDSVVAYQVKNLFNFS